MSITTDPLEQIARIGQEALDTIRQRLEHEEAPPRKELLEIDREALKEMEVIDFNAEAHDYYLNVPSDTYYLDRQ